MPKPSYSPESFRAAQDVDRLVVDDADPAREERRRVGIVVDAEIEPAEFERGRVLQEEVAPLRIEQGEARDVDVPLVERRVGEIGVVGQRAGQRRRDLVEDVAARPDADAGAVARRVPHLLVARQGEGLHVEAQSVADPADAGRACRSA